MRRLRLPEPAAYALVLVIVALTSARVEAGLEHLRFVTTPLAGLGMEEGICRRDPSDVIRWHGRYLVFYTKVTADEPLYPSGYPGEIWYASSEDGGATWRERGLVLAPGPVGAFDSSGVFTPNILPQDGRLYLFYTGVGDGFDNARDDFSLHNRTAIGVAAIRLDAHGNVAYVQRLNAGDPILVPSDPQSDRFDSFRVDDAAMHLRDGRVWLYYKGRRHLGYPRGTQMGIAVADSVSGPFRRLGQGHAVQPEGHEVMVLPHGAGVLSVISAAGRGLYYAGNGVDFRKISETFEGSIHAPGAYRPDLVDEPTTLNVAWGISMMHGPHPYLLRWDLAVPDGATRLPAPDANPAAMPTGRPDYRATQAGWIGDDRWIKQVADIDATLRTRGRRLGLIFLGDSITQSLGGPDRDVWSPGAIARERHFASYELANFGISGDQTQHLRWRVDRGMTEHIDDPVLVIMIGTNNIPHHTPEEIAGGIGAIIDDILKAAPASRILLIGILPRGWTAQDRARRHVRETNACMAHLGDLDRVTYRDFRELFVDGAGRLHARLYAADALHLRPDGYEVWARAVAEAVSDLDRKQAASLSAD
jgi:lysophospholipase L1-like esterase